MSEEFVENRYFLLKEVSSDSYVGDHNKTNYWLVQKDKAYKFFSKNEALICKKNLKDYCGLFSEVIVVENNLK